MSASVDNKYVHIIKNIYGVIFGFLYRILPTYPFRKMKFYDDKQLIDFIKMGKSIARIGDGELRIMEEIPSNFFQENDEKLSKALKNVVRVRDDNLIICMPKPLKTLKGLKVGAKLFWISNIYRNRKSWRKAIDLDYIYGNTQITRPYIDYAKKESIRARDRFNDMKTIWSNKKVCIIEGENTHLGEGNDLFCNAKSIERLLAPSKNAYKKYDSILKRVRSLTGYDIYLIALGPTATVLASDICKDGKCAVDIGHIDIEYEWMLRNAKKKQLIRGKYVNEAIGKK